MNALKGYFQTVSKIYSTKPSKNARPAALAPAMEMSVTPPNGSGSSTLVRSPLASRPSIFPEGDFRNTPVENVLDIKADVMVSWLHQQQVEKLWSTSLPGEGVVLKKGRDNFTCCPLSLRNEGNGLFDQIAALNVKVCIKPHVN
jgi:hypothetical protein